MTDTDKHEFEPNDDLDFDNPDSFLCQICGDAENGNDHQEYDSPTHIWMDIEGLTEGDINILNDLIDRFPLDDVVSWASDLDWENKDYDSIEQASDDLVAWLNR